MEPTDAQGMARFYMEEGYTVTIIAVRDNIIAADRQAGINGTAATLSKLFTIKDGALVPIWGGAEAHIVIGISGDYALGLLRAHWYLDDDTEDSDYPKAIDNHWARLVVASHGSVVAYEDYPIALRYLDPYIAFGTGMDYAMGAMYCGANAIEAVSAACVHDINCGKGIDHVTLLPYPASPKWDTVSTGGNHGT